MGCSISRNEEETKRVLNRHTGNRPTGIGIKQGLVNGNAMENNILSVTEREAIRSTWATMESNMSYVGKQIFLCIFDQNPKVKSLFPFRDAWGDDLIFHPQFVAHTLRFMAVVKKAVRAIDNLEEDFAPALISLGARHTKHVGFTPDLFALFRSSMLVIWERELRDKMTPETRRAWNVLLEFIVRKLQQGYYGQAKIEELDTHSINDAEGNVVDTGTTSTTSDNLMRS